MVEEKDKELPFEVQITINLNYSKNRLFNGSGGENEYIIYGLASEEKKLDIKFSNKLSTLSVNFIDKNTKDFLEGGKIRIGEKQYVLNTENDILLEGLGKDEIIYVYIEDIPENEYLWPEEYLLENGEYKVEIILPYNINYIKNIELTSRSLINENENISMPKEENINKEIDEKNKIIQEDKNEHKEDNNIQEKNIENKKERNLNDSKNEILVLPRTGNDYFTAKLILADLFLFIIFEILFLKIF